MGRLLATVLAMLLMLSGCHMQPQQGQEPAEPESLKDLAYDANSHGDSRVYLYENGELVPYLVLTVREGGSCLLLREHLLDTDRVYSNGGRKSGYYGTSEIDKFLNDEFSACLSQEVRSKLVDSDIVIAAQESLGNGGDDTEIITRKVFLLSFTELNGGSSRSNPVEGTPVAYFEKQENRIARYADGAVGSWWLRTANTSGRTVVIAVTVDGVPAMCPIYDAIQDGGCVNGVRPAFCLSGDLPLVKADVSGGQVFTVENPSVSQG